MELRADFRHPGIVARPGEFEGALERCRSEGHPLGDRGCGRSAPSLFGGDPGEALKSFVSRQPMGRLGAAVEIADLALNLASDESAFTTGAMHVIDGGWSA